MNKEWKTKTAIIELEYTKIKPNIIPKPNVYKTSIKAIGLNDDKKCVRWHKANIEEETKILNKGLFCLSKLLISSNLKIYSSFHAINIDKQISKNIFKEKE